MAHILGSFHKGNFSNDVDRNDREKVIRFETNMNLQKCDYFAIFASALQLDWCARRRMKHREFNICLFKLSSKLQM